MIIKPVRNYKTPAYPTIEQYVYHPQELLRYAPHSWLGNAAVWTALVAFSVGGNSCKSGKKPANESVEIVDIQNDNIQPQQKNTDTIQVVDNQSKPIRKQIQKQEISDTKSCVAPIFVHGDGIGAFGCMVTAPPVILSEEDALQIIKAGLAKHNLRKCP